MLENPIVSGTFPYEEREGMLLEDLLDEYPAEAFRIIDNDSKANWAVKQILKDRADTNRLIALADEEINYLHDRRKALMERQESREGYLKALLMDYFERVEPSTSTKTQTTYKLLAGKLVKKRQQPEYQRDDAALLDWAKANAPDMVQTKESVTWGELKKLTTLDGEKVVLAETGEIVSGVVAVERPDVFEVQA